MFESEGLPFGMTLFLTVTIQGGAFTVLFTKCIYREATPEDGVRISVLSGHTDDDGVTPDLKITEDSYDEWLQELAPPTWLLGRYYRENLPWYEFQMSYLEFLSHRRQATLVWKLARRALTEDVTIMGKEEDPEFCHRRLLAEECQRAVRELTIVIG